MHKVLINRLGGLSLLRKSVVRLTERPDMTLDIYRGRKTTIQQKIQSTFLVVFFYVMVENWKHLKDTLAFSRFLYVRIEIASLLTIDLLPNISLVVSQWSVNISLALMICPLHD